MARYRRPNVEVSVPFPAPILGKDLYYHYSRERWVTSPKGSEPTPHQSFKGSVQVTYYSPSPDGRWIAQDARNGHVSYYVQNGSEYTIPLMNEALEKAYSRFKDKIYGEMSELGVNLAERRQAVDMIVNRATSLFLAFRALKQRKWKKVLSLLNISGYKGRRWRYAHNASAAWLELHFGWVPFLNDIYNATMILQSDYGPPRAVKASGKAQGEKLIWSSSSYLTNVTFRCRVGMGATVTVDNPNLHRATALGLVNPASIAWELIPFSFLIDWFVPIGNFLNSWSDFSGLSFGNAYTSYTRLGEGTMLTFSSDTRCETYGSAVNYSRSLGIAKPVIYPKIVRSLSVTRAATAISLLISVFHGGRA